MIMSGLYCQNCKQYVNGKKFNWLILILLLIFLFPIGLVYGAYCTFRRPHCPICKMTLYKSSKPAETPAPTQVYTQPAQVYRAPQQPVQNGNHQVDAVYCPGCGKKCSSNESYCENCGEKLKK